MSETIPASVVSIVAVLLRTAYELVVANGDAKKEEDALMSAEEAIARERARRKFG